MQTLFPGTDLDQLTGGLWPGPNMLPLRGMGDEQLRNQGYYESVHAGHMSSWATRYWQGRHERLSPEFFFRHAATEQSKSTIPIGQVHTATKNFLSRADLRIQGRC